MKRFMQFIAAIKSVAALAFTALIMLATVLSMLFGRDGIPISYIWQMIFISLIYSCIQFAVFSESYFMKMKTTGRTTILGVSMLLVLSVFAIAFQWFPVQDPMNWVIFVGSCAAVFVIAVVALRTVFRLGGIKYDQMLAVYKANREK